MKQSRIELGVLLCSGRPENISFIERSAGTEVRVGSSSIPIARTITRAHTQSLRRQDTRWVSTLGAVKEGEPRLNRAGRCLKKRKAWVRSADWSHGRTELPAVQ